MLRGSNKRVVSSMTHIDYSLESEDEDQYDSVGDLSEIESADEEPDHYEMFSIPKSSRARSRPYYDYAVTSEVCHRTVPQPSHATSCPEPMTLKTQPSYPMSYSQVTPPIQQRYERRQPVQDIAERTALIKEEEYCPKPTEITAVVARERSPSIDVVARERSPSRDVDGVARERNPSIDVDSASAEQEQKDTVYAVTVYTGDKRLSGTDANIYITIFGKQGDSGERKIGSPENNFDRHSADEFFVGTRKLGPLERIRVRHDNSGDSASWYLNQIVVQDTDTGSSFVFPCHQWLSTDEGDGCISRDLIPNPVQDDVQSEKSSISGEEESVDNSKARMRTQMLQLYDEKCSLEDRVKEGEMKEGYMKNEIARLNKENERLRRQDLQGQEANSERQRSSSKMKLSAHQYSNSLEPRMILPKQVLEDVVSYRAHGQLKHVDPTVSTNVRVQLGRFNPGIHVKITREAFKLGIEREDKELLDVVIPCWKELNDDDNWHPMIQIAKDNKAGLFSRLSLKHHLGIPEPHDYFCTTETCKVKDSLKHSLLRINTYKALAQAAHLLSTEDPIREAFELRSQMLRLSNDDKEFKNEYLALSASVEEFCCNMAKLCGKKIEVDLFLDRSHDKEIVKERTKLGTVRKAYEDEAKLFVAHEFVQHHLHEDFYGESARQQQLFLNHGNLTKMLICVGLSPLIVLMLLGYVIFGGFKSLKERCPIPFYYIMAMKDPVIKFYTHTMSYCFFLILLLVYTLQPVASAHGHRNTMFSWVLWGVSFYIVGYTWAEIRQLYLRGYRCYLRSIFNWLDTTMIMIYLASFTCRIIAYYKSWRALKYEKSHPVGPYPDDVQYYLQADRNLWEATDPEILADSLFAVANLLSFARMSYILPAFEVLGPLLTILGKMLIDVMYFMALFVIVFFAFLVGIHNLYMFYDDSNFSSVENTFVNLFWGVFAMADNGLTSFNTKQVVVQTVGFLMFGTFHVMIVIMLLNMLIAMLSSSFENTENMKDAEWKFARAGLYMDYIVKGDTVPVPFNIIPTAKSIWRLLRKMSSICCNKQRLELRKKSHKSQRKQKRFKIQYLNLMKRLKLKYAKAFLNGQEIVVSINQVNHEVITRPPREPASSRPAVNGGGDGDIERTESVEVSSPPPGDATDGQDHGLPAMGTDPVRDLLMRYFRDGLDGERRSSTLTRNVMEELHKSSETLKMSSQ